MSSKVFAWVFIAVALAVMLVFSILRIELLWKDALPTDAFDLRYVDHPVVSLLHILPGMLYLVLGPLQFIAGIRARYPAFHRALGCLLIACGLLSGLFALIAAFILPAWGGLSTQTATLLFGTLFLFSLLRALWHIRNGEIPQHREWMLRA